MLLGASIQAQTTVFTFQGRLTDNTMAANANYDFEFTLYDALTGGAIVGATATRTAVPVSNGVFTVQLDFTAAAFPGADRFLLVSVKRSSDPMGTPFTPLTPRQQITSAPYAIRALNATAADELSAACVLCVTDAQITSISGSKVTGSVANATNATTATSATTAGNVTGVVAIANGGTGSTTQNFVDLTTTQTVAGDKTFTSPVNTTTQYNIGGNRALSVSVPGRDNLFAGLNAGNTDPANTGTNNSFVGASAGANNTTGFSNSFVGRTAGLSNTTGSSNSFVGTFAGAGNTTGGNNSFVGRSAGTNNTTGSNNTAIGNQANLNANNRIFASAIGANALATADDTIVIGKVAGNYIVNGVSGARPADAVQIPGNLVVTGSITGASKSFKIDHPLDPQNKTLTYTSIESPDVKNIYDGNVTTDENGEAIVSLPDYFQALNKDYRYQLTVIGKFAQAIVSDEIKGNQFKIRTDQPGVKVSWQVTGIRKDKFAEDNRAPNVQDKPESQRGTCLYAPACGEATTGETLIKPRP